jgi:hypothetical protein
MILMLSNRGINPRILFIVNDVLLAFKIGLQNDMLNRENSMITTPGIDFYALLILLANIVMKVSQHSST